MPIFFLYRYLATGAYRTVVPRILNLLQEKTGVRQAKILPWEVYTPKDISLYGHNMGVPASETTYKRKVGCQDSSRSNKKSVLSLLNGIRKDMDKTYSLVFIHKAKVNPAQPTHR